MRIRDVISFAVFGAIIVLVLGYFATLGIRVKPPPDRINLSMEAADLNGLVVGSNVLLRGVPVGKVTATGATVQAATVEFYVQDRYRIPVGSEVRLENLSALGESYISLLPHSEEGPILQDGQSIATEQVTQPASISELANSVVRVLNQLNPEELERILGELDAALPDPAVTLPNISRASILLRNTAADMRGRGRVLLENFQSLLRNAEWVGPVLFELDPIIRDLGLSIQDLYRHIPGMMHRGEPENVMNFYHFLQRVQKFLDDRGPDLKVFGDALQPKLNLIAGALMNLDTGQLLDNMLATVPPDGTITLRVIP
ncbi:MULTISPECIES: MlaD family protein [unclassified Mycobacterium]|uniref:MlaD family protein n=1 Tax=unclassified Mycobacterium TaxID=2642494 RepID=UPI00073FD048|nr:MULTISPECIES: MlaD family protein [unclassified Mycobacterium]KUH85963.1 mammalian cell entry protein [Mycobacterium sp. GA-0227b]KUH85975.1 mammalian cell entry protein [Mycobacterium sp. GA-1999]KUH87767.1 mammalian cell entry protein [Mycobacterium sp. IS-1556]